MYNTSSAAEKEVDKQRLTNKTNKLTEVEKIVWCLSWFQSFSSLMVFSIVTIYNNKIMHFYKEKHPAIADSETSTALPTTPADNLHEDSDTRHVELELQTNVAYEFENVPMN